MSLSDIEEISTGFGVCSAFSSSPPVALKGATAFFVFFVPLLSFVVFLDEVGSKGGDEEAEDGGSDSLR